MTSECVGTRSPDRCEDSNEETPPRLSFGRAETWMNMLPACRVGVTGYENRRFEPNSD